MQPEFRGTERYIATPELMAAVNAAMVLSRPLLIRGEPGTGKTLLAAEIARSLGKPLFEPLFRVPAGVPRRGLSGRVLGKNEPGNHQRKGDETGFHP